MKIVVYYFAEGLATIHGTPLVPIRLDVSPSMDVGALKYMVCYASGLIEDMMALMTPKKPTAEEVGYFRSKWGYSIFDERTIGDVPSLVNMFSRRRLDENQRLEELEIHSLGLSIDINWLKRCPVCGHKNKLSKAERVVGLDNIPDLDVDYACSNFICSEHRVKKKFDIRIARWRLENGTLCALPLITAVWNGASCAFIYGSKTEPPKSCSIGGAEKPKLSRSEYCRCGASNPTDAFYCWNCGKKNKNVQSKPKMLLSYDLDKLREQVELEAIEAQKETIARDIAIVEELIRRGVIVEIVFCKHCGEQNKADAVHCQKCGRRIAR